MNDRPDWLPERLTWYLGEKPRCPVEIREPLRQDAKQMIRMAHDAGEKLGAKHILRLLMASEWPCYLAVRNRRVAIGMAWGLARPSGTEIRLLYVDPVHRGRGIEKRLATLLSLELPECTTTYKTKLSDKYHAGIFSDWKTSHADEARDEVTYIQQHIKRAAESETFNANG